MEMERYYWRGFSFVAPREWEMLQFSTDEKDGRCVFADRYRFRYELSWRKVPGPPQLNLMIGNYLSKLREEKQATGVNEKREGPWSGLGGRSVNQKFSQFIRYFPASECLVETVFLWPEKIAVAQEREMLNSIAEHEEEGGQTRWRGFSLDVRSPYPVQGFTVNPAAVKFVFGYEQNWREQMKVERRGMVKEWMNAPLHEWVSAQVPLSVKNPQPGTRELESGVTCHLVTGQKKLAPARRVQRMALGKGKEALGEQHLNYLAAAWISPRDKRLVFVESQDSLETTSDEVLRRVLER